MDCLKYPGSQVMKDAIHRMNAGYRACGALKSVLRNRGLGIMAKKCLYLKLFYFHRICIRYIGLLSMHLHSPN